ncbi:hypothetical protein RyT2_06350 [Pseudolactococcus yaeyamensis]
MTINSFNNTTQRVIDDLKQEIRRGAKLKIAAASFSIYAYEALKKELEKIDELQFLFTSNVFTKEKISKEAREFYIPCANRERRYQRWATYGKIFGLIDFLVASHE